MENTTPIIAELNFLFERDLNNLIKNIDGYRSDEDIWIKTKEIPNSGGNLCLHICGNLKYYIGSILGKSGYIRNREEEFSKNGMTKAELIIEIQSTIDVINSVFSNLSAKQFNESYPLPFHNETWTTRKFLLHLYGHLNYHLGQIDYHRRGVV